MKDQMTHDEAVSKLADLAEENERMRTALERIERWHVEFPATGRYWDEPNNDKPMSYSACFGSNGEREYMRQVARDALPQNANTNGLAPDAVDSIHCIKCARCSNQYTPRPGFAQCPSCGA